jgi:3',5'-cyclic AMP phosphodiesterase CpdA
MKQFRAAFPIVILIFLIINPSAAQRRRLGLPPTVGIPENRILHTANIINGTPEIIVFSEGNRKKATIRFQTTKALPEAYCYYGIYFSDQKVQTPVFRHYSREGKVADSLNHHITIDLSRLEYPVHDSGKNLAKQGGGTVAYKLLLHDPQNAKTHMFTGRFEYRNTNKVVCIVSGPWVDFTAPGQVTISWDTDRESAGILLLDSTRYFSPQNTHHEIVINNIKGTLHHYKVTAVADSVEVATPEFRFRMPEPGKPFLFAAMSDSRAGYGGAGHNFNGCNFQDLRNLFLNLYSQGAEFALFAGDLVNGHTTDERDYIGQLDAWKKAVEPIGHIMPIFEGMGNHDYVIDRWDDPRTRGGIRTDQLFGKSSEEIFAEIFVNPEYDYPEKEHPQAPTYKENTYYFDWGNVRMISLNTNYWWTNFPEDIGGNLQGYIMDNQLDWLKKVLKQAQKDKSIDHIFIFTHEPAFPVSGHIYDAMWYSGGDPQMNKDIDKNPLNRQHVIDRRDRFLELVAKHGKVRAYITGHEHLYARLLIDSQTPIYPDGSANKKIKPIYEFITGGAGAPYYSLTKENIPWRNAIKAYSCQQHYLLFGVDKLDVYVYVVSGTQEIIEAVKIVENGLITDTPVSENTIGIFNR